MSERLNKVWVQTRCRLQGEWTETGGVGVRVRYKTEASRGRASDTPTEEEKFLNKNKNNYSEDYLVSINICEHQCYTIKLYTYTYMYVCCVLYVTNLVRLVVSAAEWVNKRLHSVNFKVLSLPSLEVYWSRRIGCRPSRLRWQSLREGVVW